MKNVDFISTSNLELKDAFSDCELFILGNITSFDRNSHDALSIIMEERKFVKIEFDYGYCKYRGRIPHEILGGAKCGVSLSSIWKHAPIRSVQLNKK